MRILNVLFPFAITLALWRLSWPVINPCGVLAIIPIFYYSFVRPRSEFLPMAVIGCFLIDYNFNTTLFWTTSFCIAYAINYMNPVFRGAILRRDGLYSFAIMTGVLFLLLGVWALFKTWNWAGIAQAAWTWALTTFGYFGWTRIGGKR